MNHEKFPKKFLFMPGNIFSVVHRKDEKHQKSVFGLFYVNNLLKNLDRTSEAVRVEIFSMQK